MSHLKLAFVALLAVTPAFGDMKLLSSGEFELAGTWAAQDASTGKWHADMTVKENGMQFDVKEELVIELPDGTEMKEKMEWTALPKTNNSGFFDMIAGRATIGWGQCEDTGCQIQGEGWAETFAFSKAGSTVSGSKEDPKAGRIVWRGTISKK